MKILALCDSPTMTTGFARVAQNLFRRWHAAGVTVDCWGVGFRGWSYRQHPYVNEFFPAGGGGEWCQPVNLTLFLGQLSRGNYTHVWIMQDTFLLSRDGFPKALRKLCKKKGIHSTLYFPVDAPLDPLWTEIICAVETPVAYTHYGRNEAIKKILESDFNLKEERIAVLPHGVDTELHRPLSLADFNPKPTGWPDARTFLRRHFWKECWVGPDDFLMLNVNMNQRRKDVSRSLEILAELRRRNVPAKLLMHMPECSSDGLSLAAVGAQLGLKVDKDWGHHGLMFRGAQSQLSEAKLMEIYNLADCYLTTTLGEGWGLGITEALACGLPVAMPDHTACSEIGNELEARGMGDRVMTFKTEPHACYLENDNSRQRYRTDVRDAANRIENYYRLGEWRKRPALNEAVRDWLSWDRVAAQFLKLMGGEGKAESGNVQASAPAVEGVTP